MHEEKSNFIWLNSRPMARDTCAQSFDHFAMDFEFDVMPTRKRTSDLLEDSLDKMWQTPITHELRVADNCLLESDYFYDNRLPVQLDDIFGATEVLTTAQTANSTPVIKSKFLDHQTERCDRVSLQSSTNAFQEPIHKGGNPSDQEMSVEESDREPSFCVGLRFP